MQNQTFSSKNMDLTNISEFDSSGIPALQTLVNIDQGKLVLEMEEAHRKTREQMPKGPNYLMRNEAKRLTTLLALEPTSTWSPKELAAAGFFCTGLNNSSQCYCCGLVLCRQSLSSTPLENHWKFNRDCGFIQGKEVGNILKYDVRVQILESNVKNEDMMESEETRLMSFTSWPAYVRIQPAMLALSGFFFTGRRDAVQCFSCGGCLGNWEEGDDAWREHAKWFPECAFLHSKQSKNEIKQYIQSYCGFTGVTGTSFSTIWGKRKLSTGAEKTYEQIQHLEEMKTLNEQLVQIYNDPLFYKLSSFEESIKLGIDLKSLYADICVVSKDTRNQPLQRLTLPDILSDLRDITMIEGEAGSGKTALLRKIAILWASGGCPILSRFSLVFYISVSSIESQQTMADIICKQLIGPTTSLTNETLRDIMKQLKSQVLFLLDDYAVMDSVAIEELLRNNHLNRVSLAVTSRTDRGRRLRQYARTILSLQEFPLYSTIYLVKNLFSHDLERVKAFFIELETQKSLQATLRTPLVTLAQCSYWLQHPGGSTISDTHIFKVYLLYNMLKFPRDTERVKALVSSCGELALKGLLQSRFDFTEDDLHDVGVSSDEALQFGLLSKFTAQRLRPSHRFFHPSFQEFLAGKRLSEFLESDTQEDLDKGLHYLQHVNTFLKVAGPHQYLLKYASVNSSKATLNILSYLFSLFNSKEALDCHLESKEHLQRHPELQLAEEYLIIRLREGDRATSESLFMRLLLTFAVNAAVESQCLSDCAPIIMQFLAGKTLSFTVSPIKKNIDNDILFFLGKYPESIALLSSIQVCITGNKGRVAPDFLAVSKMYENQGVPTVEQDYSSAYLNLNDMVQKNLRHIKEMNEFLSLFPQQIGISDSLVHPFLSLAGHKVHVFKMNVGDIHTLTQNDIKNVKVLFSISNRIELELNKSSGFVTSIRPAIEKYLDSFRRCIIHDTELSAEEQELLLMMSSLESLEIRGADTQPPDLLFSGLHTFTCLEELSIDLPKYQGVIDQIPAEFGRLCRIKKFAFLNFDLASGSTRFVQLIQNFRYLEVLHLSFKSFPDFKGLMTSLSSCHELKELRFSTSSLQDTDMACLASALKYFKSLKVLDLEKQSITATDISENFALALGSLVHLEELRLPTGEGMAQAAKLFIAQLQKLPNLRILILLEILNDESILELARAAKNGYLKGLRQLDLKVNVSVTESGWRTCFQTADNMPELCKLDLGRMYTHQIKCHATTVKSFVQFVSRLPSLVTIVMHGWLLDADDLNMFNRMKDKHPQSKSLHIVWQWFLPGSPNIEQ